MSSILKEAQMRDDLKVAELALADWGRKEMLIAESEMPALMAIRAEYAAPITTGTEQSARACLRIAGLRQRDVVSGPVSRADTAGPDTHLERLVCCPKTKARLRRLRWKYRL
jgi:hypothetical protein